ncbi:hypothetical protein CKQ90_16005, partial [Klebsiella pneumoniae]
AFPLQSQAFIFAFLCEVLTGTPLTRRPCLPFVPCQWRRIIGSNSEVTRGNAKKLFVRSIFHHNASFTRYLRAICAISRANRDTCCQSV